MSRRLIGTTLLAVLLAGCATPTPAPPPVPVPTVTTATGLDCDAVVGPALRAQALLVGERSIDLEPQQVSFDGIGLASSGLLQCRWSSQPVNTEYPPTLILNVLPDAAEAFAAFTAERPHLGGLADSLSPGSSVWCSTEFGWAECTLDFESDGYWVSIILDTEAAGRTPAEAELDATAVGQGIIANLSGLAAPVVVEGTGDALGRWASCVELGQVFDEYTLTSDAAAAEGEALNQYQAALSRTKIAHCSWSDDEIISQGAEVGFAKVSIVEGGASSWPALKDAYLEDPNGALGWEIDVEGAVEAVVLCHPQANCAVVASAGGSVLRAELSMALSTTGESSYDEQFLTDECVTALERAIAALRAR